MKTKQAFMVIGILAVPLTGTLFGQGKEVRVLLNNGQEIEGELLSVRDSSLVVSTLEDFDPDDQVAQTRGIITLGNQEILRVVLKGESKILKGMGLGTLIGGGFGAALGFASGDDPPGWFSLTAGEKSVAGGIVFGAVGFIIGTVAGLASSSRDKIVEPLPDQDFSSLRPFAKFPEKEPEFLKQIR